MNYTLYFYFALLTLSSNIFTTNITFINDSMFTVFLTDHLNYGALIAPQEKYSLQNNKTITLYLYTQPHNIDQKFNLMYRIAELQISTQPITISYHDVTSNNLYKKYPGQFEITHQTKILLEQHKQSIQVNKNSSHDTHHSMHTQTKPHPYDNTHHHPGGPPQAVLDSIISQYNQMLEQKNNKGISSDMFQVPPVHRYHEQKTKTKK